MVFRLCMQEESRHKAVALWSTERLATGRLNFDNETLSSPLPLSVCIYPVGLHLSFMERSQWRWILPWKCCTSPWQSLRSLLAVTKTSRVRPSAKDRSRRRVFSPSGPTFSMGGRSGTLFSAMEHCPTTSPSSIQRLGARDRSALPVLPCRYAMDTWRWLHPLCVRCLPLVFELTSCCACLCAAARFRWASSRCTSERLCVLLAMCERRAKTGVGWCPLAEQGEYFFLFEVSFGFFFSVSKCS